MLKTIAVSIAAGMLGFALMGGAWHLCGDHATWHALLNNIAQQQQQKAAK